MPGPDLTSIADELVKAASGIPKLEVPLKANAARLRAADHAAFLNGARVVAENIVRTVITTKSGAPPQEKAGLDALMQEAHRLELLPAEIRDHLEGVRRHGNPGSHGRDNDLLGPADESVMNMEQRAGAALFELRAVVLWFLREHSKRARTAELARPEEPARPADLTPRTTASGDATLNVAVASKEPTRGEGATVVRRAAIIVLAGVLAYCLWQLAAPAVSPPPKPAPKPVIRIPTHLTPRPLPTH